MKKNKLRWIAFLTGTALALSLAGCSPKKQAVPGGEPQSGTDALFEKDVELSLIVGSNVSWPYNENWAMWKLFKERVGGNLNIRAIPNEELGTKVSLMMSTPDELPDMIFFISAKSLIDSLGPTGAFVPISDHLDKMPNYVKFWNSLSETDRTNAMLQRVSGDGKIYFPPNYGNETVGNMRSWMYRKDIFEKHGLTPPNTFEEMYQTAKKLKELYPDSYPISMRSGFQNLENTGSSWKSYFSPFLYYDYNAEKWCYGAAEPVMREMTEYYRKLVQEGLIPPDFLSINAKSWEELVLTDRGFMMPEYLLRLDFFNGPGRQENPEYTWAIMEPPKADTPEGQRKIARLNYELAGYTICNTKDQTRIDNAFKLLDWLYSDEGCEFEGWGVEGITYEVVNGDKKFLIDESEGETVYAKFGIGTPGLYQRVDTAANEALYSEEQGKQGRVAYNYQEEKYNPAVFMAFADDLEDERADLVTAIRTYTEEMLSKFILGQEPMSQWDSFQKELQDMGLERLLELYEEMYERVMDGSGMKWVD